MHLLQYAYSNKFGYSGAGTSLLFKKLGFVFGASINHTSLREAILAFAAAFLPSHSRFELSECHARRACRVLITTNCSAFAEADLFAAGLLTIQNAFCRNEQQFSVYLQIFMRIMQSLVKGSTDNEAMFTRNLFPVIRDMILEGSRFLTENSNDLVLQFCYRYQEVVGQQNFTGQEIYKKEFFGFESRELAFYRCLWEQFRLLRRCFRHVVIRECYGNSQKEVHVQSIILEIKDYLDSTDVREIITQIATKQIMNRAALQDPLHYGGLTFTTLIYRFSCLMISLLQGETIILGTASVDAIARATSLLELIRTDPVPPIVLYPTFTWWNSNPTLPRILCIAGLQFPREIYPECTISSF